LRRQIQAEHLAHDAAHDPGRREIAAERVERARGDQDRPKGVKALGDVLRRGVLQGRLAFRVV